jgi:hypothetical protein
MYNIVFYKQRIKVQSSLNLKYIKFIQILLENYFCKIRKQCTAHLSKPAQPAYFSHGGPFFLSNPHRPVRERRPVEHGPLPADPLALASARACALGNLGLGRQAPSRLG